MRGPISSFRLAYAKRQLAKVGVPYEENGEFQLIMPLKSVYEETAPLIRKAFVALSQCLEKAPSHSRIHNMVESTTSPMRKYLVVRFADETLNQELSRTLKNEIKPSMEEALQALRDNFDYEINFPGRSI